MNDRVTAERIRMKVDTGYAYNYYMGGKAAANTAANKTFDKNMAKAGNMPVITFDEDGAEENVAADKSKEASSTNIRDMSNKEWDKLIEHVDKFIDEFKEAVEYENEVSKENKEKFEETAKDIIETLNDNEMTRKELTKEQELALTGSTSTGVSSTDGVTECVSAEDIGEAKTTWTVTVFTEDGITCTQFKDGVKTELWRMSYKHKGDYEKITDFLNSFDKNSDLKFASSKSFWEDFLDGKISDEELRKLY